MIYRSVQSTQYMLERYQLQNSQHYKKFIITINTHLKLKKGQFTCAFNV